MVIPISEVVSVQMAEPLNVGQALGASRWMTYHNTSTELPADAEFRIRLLG